MRIRIYPYKQGSKSAKAIAEGLGGKVLKLVGSNWKQREQDRVINWGASRIIDAPEQWGCGVWINQVSAIGKASNKLTAFQCLKNADVSIPKFATSAEDLSWDGNVVVRHKLTGHSGEGIEIYDHGQELPEAPLYVEYIPKKHEYRVHIIKEKIIAVQRKARDKSNPNPNWQVRNHDNGFVFVRQNVNPPEDVLEVSRRAIAALGLDFGAVDVIWNNKQQKAYVLEVNTAPGLEGQTIEDYVNGFKELLSSG